MGLAMLCLAGCASLASAVLAPKIDTAATSLAPGDFVLDTTHAALLFRINHLGFADYAGRFDRFEALVRGYLSSATFLNEAERENLAFSGKLITLECGMRFLTDYLQGDVYFKTSHPGHNLDRCRNQFAFVRVLEENMAAMEEIVKRC